MTEITRYRELATVFRAAARGATAPFDRMQSGASFSTASYDHAQSMAGVLDAIADVYAKMAEAEEAGNKYSQSPAPWGSTLTWPERDRKP